MNIKQYFLGLYEDAKYSLKVRTFTENFFAIVSAMAVVVLLAFLVFFTFLFTISLI